MKTTMEILTKSNVTLFEVKHPSLIHHLTEGKSFGYSNLPPGVAKRINLYADGQKLVFNQRELQIMFFAAPLQCCKEKHTQSIVERILWEATAPTMPYVWVMIPRIIIPNILGALDMDSVTYYYHVAPSEHTRLYDIYKEEGKYKAALFDRKYLLHNVN